MPSNSPMQSWMVYSNIRNSTRRIVKANTLTQNSIFIVPIIYMGNQQNGIHRWRILNTQNALLEKSTWNFRPKVNSKLQYQAYEEFVPRNECHWKQKTTKLYKCTQQKLQGIPDSPIICVILHFSHLLNLWYQTLTKYIWITEIGFKPDWLSYQARQYLELGNRLA